MLDNKTTKKDTGNNQKSPRFTLSERIFFIISFVLVSMFYSLFMLSTFKLHLLYEYIAWLLFLLIMFLIERGIKKIYQKISAKKINTVLLLLFLIGAINSYANKGYFYSVSNYFKDGFYFEKFETADAAFEEVRLEKIENFRKKHPHSYSGNDQRQMSIDDYQKIDMRRKIANYDNDVTTKLLELHPIGSDIYDAIKTIERAGAKCGIYVQKTIDDKQFYNGKWHNTKKIIYVEKKLVTNKQDEINCYYKEAGVIFPTDWRIFIEVDNEAKIKRISGVVYKTPL